MALKEAKNYIVRRLQKPSGCASEGGIIDGSGLGKVFFWGGTAPVAADRPAPGAVWADTTNKLVKHNTGTLASPSWTALTTASSFTLDGAYNADTGERTVAVDDGHVVFDLEDNSNDYCVKINNSTGGEIAAALVLDAEDSSSSFVDAISIITTNGAITDAIDVSDAGITNAINIGGNAIAGSNFSVNAAGVVTATGVSGLSTLSIGSDGSAGDIYGYSGTSGDYMMWDGSEKTLLFVDSKAHFQDGDELHFGTGSATGTGDFKVLSDGADLYVLANADVAGQTLYLGNDTSDLDVVWEGDTNAATVTFDSSADQLTLNGVTFRMQDSDKIQLGDGASSNGDFELYSDGTHCYLNAVANSDGATLYLSDDTHALDIVWEGTTNGDVVTFDHSADEVIFTDIGLTLADSGNNECLDITGNGATSKNVVEINSSAVIGSDKALLQCYATGNLAAGGSILRLDYASGTPNAGSYMLELDGAGKDLVGMYSDVDSTGDAYTFHCGGATGSGDAVMLVSSDGTPAAADSYIFDLQFSGDDANEPILMNLAATGTGVNSGGIYLATESDGVSCWHLNVVDAKDDALGVVFRTHQDSASPAAGDAIFTLDMLGEDAGSAATEYCKLEAEIMTATAGQEDGRFVLSCAADDGTLTEMATLNPRAGTAVPELSLGAAAGGRVTTGSAHSLYLDTNRGTTSAAIEIESGANSDVTVTLQGTGEFKLAGAGDITTVSTVDLVLDTNEGTNAGSITLANGADGDITIAPNGSGSTVIDNAAVRYATRAVAAGTATDSPSNTDGIVQYTTNGAQACAVTLPEAASNLGLELTLVCASHGGQDVTATRTGADVIDEDGDTGNTTVTFDATGEMIVLRAVGDNKWLVVARVGATLG